MRTLVSLGTLTLVFGSLYWFEANPRVLLFAFLMSTAAQMALITISHRLAESAPWKRVLSSCTRPPSDAELERARASHAAPDAMKGPWTFGLVLAALAYLVFVLSHVDRDQELHFDGNVFQTEITLALLLTLFFVIESLVLRETPLAFDEPLGVNLHFVSTRIAVLAFAALLGGAAVAFFQTSNREITPWTLTVPLLVFKHWLDRPPAPSSPSH